MPELPDASDRPVEPSKQPKLHGWTIEEWIEAIYRQPERTLPNGVGAALIAHFHRELQKLT